MSEVHECEVCSTFLTSGYNAICSCGWEGPNVPTSMDAIETWDDHCDNVFFEATS